MMRALDLFAGAGGWDVGCEAVGVDVDGVEVMPEATATRDAAGLSTIHDDVWTLPAGMADGYDGLIASPPCQTFSQAGGGSGRKALDAVLAVLPNVADMTLTELRTAGDAFGDERTALVLTPLWCALHHPYRWIAWEQVPAVLPVWEECATVLALAGWSTWTGCLQAEQYGVPQTRRRAFLLATRDGVAAPPTPTHSRYYPRTPSKLDPGVARWVSMAEALGWGMTRRPYPTIAPGVGQGGPDALMVGGSGARRIIYGERDAARWIENPACVEYVNGTHEKAARRPGDRPAPTVMFGERLNTVEWQPRHGADEPCDCPVTFTATNPRPHAAHRTPCQPAPTIAFGHEQPRWNPRETTPDGDPRWRDQSGTAVDRDWPDKRPSTTVASRGLVQNPGETSNRHNESTKSRNDGVRVSVGEAGTLQTFPAGFPWQGPRTRQFLQVGNAVPPLLAAHVIAAITSPAAAPRTRSRYAPEDVPMFDLNEGESA